MFFFFYLFPLKEAVKKIFHWNAYSIKENRFLAFLLVFVLFFDFILYPLPILAKEIKNDEGLFLEILDEFSLNHPEFFEVPDSANKLPETKNRRILKKEHYAMTAYTSEIAQCDASPCITANGFNVCQHGIEDTVAANFLRFGTKIKIPDLFGDRVFIVRDRMNSRYSDRVDIWMKDKKEAIKFGFKVARIEVID